MAVCGTAITWKRGNRMHFEILVEDRSGSIALEHILEKILGANGAVHYWRIHHYRGIGRLPKKLGGVPTPANRLLLDNLPGLLRGYGKSLTDSSAVIVVVDSDDRDCIAFKKELLSVLNNCNPRPKTLFRIAVEEGEAWLLGDRSAIKAAYPSAKDTILNGYVQDSVCGTWEVIADAVHSGGSKRLKRLGYPETGKTKCEWAAKIAPELDVAQNRSKSFTVFRDGVQKLAGAS